MTEQKKIQIKPYQKHVFVCTGPRCAPETSPGVYQMLKEQLKKRGLDQVQIRRSQAHCFGICSGGPIVVVYPEGVWYQGVTLEKMQVIIDRHLVGGQPVEEWKVDIQMNQSTCQLGNKNPLTS